jgi:hypothetical protein
VIQPLTQTRKYWVSDFAVSDSDIESIYNYFLEVEQPLTIGELTRVVMAQRLAEEQKDLKRRLAGRKVYQPKNNYVIGDELIFPAMKFSHGKVVSTRAGYNPQLGTFTVLKVQLNGKQREFAAELTVEHSLNEEDSTGLELLQEVDVDELFEEYGLLVAEKVERVLSDQAEFVRLAGRWFIKGLMADINVGHLHLAEAVLEVSEGGPLSVDEILVHLDLDTTIQPQVQRFSLNYALLHDDRFEEVAPAGQIRWFLARMLPEGVRQTPERLVYNPISFDRALLNTQLLSLVKELDDEWSDETEPSTTPQPVLLALTYPHRWAGTLPLNSQTAPLFPPSRSPHQRILLVDDETGAEIVGWAVQKARYVFGLSQWYQEHAIPVGGFISLRPGPEPGVVLLGYDRRKPQREWVRLATVVDNRIRFEMQRRSIGCGYDDLLIVGTDYVAAIDALWRRARDSQRPLASLLLEVVPELINLNPQGTVHAKTIYSAINMLRRVPPDPIFVELVKHSAFQPVGDHYWQFESGRAP